MVKTQLARILAAVPVLLALVYSSCPHGSGFAVRLHVGDLHVVASTCHG